MTSQKITQYKPGRAPIWSARARRRARRARKVGARALNSKPCIHLTAKRKRNQGDPSKPSQGIPPKTGTTTTRKTEPFPGKAVHQA